MKPTFPQKGMQLYNVLAFLEIQKNYLKKRVTLIFV